MVTLQCSEANEAIICIYYLLRCSESHDGETHEAIISYPTFTSFSKLVLSSTLLRFNRQYKEK